MAHLVRPLIQLLLPRWRTRRSTPISSLWSAPSRALAIPSYLLLLSPSSREVHFRSRALRPLRVPLPPDNVAGSDDDGSDSDGIGVRRSRNERKREARRAVRWGMDLATFSPSQIKRILGVAALEQEVFDAIMLLKEDYVFEIMSQRLGRDVREGKRRQFNYIGRLLREAEPELMDGLIQATKDGDIGKFRNLSGVETLALLDEEEEQEQEEDVVEEFEDDDEEEDSLEISVVTRWYGGLINKDISITNEIYSLQDVEFDRQELRQLVRKVHSTETSLTENGKQDAKAANARRSLTRFLRRLAKQRSTLI